MLVTRRGRAVTAGRIVETEAYLGPEDAASHAAFRPSSHALFYGDGGFAYVYLIYGLHACLNVVAVHSVVANSRPPENLFDPEALKRGP